MRLYNAASCTPCVSTNPRIPDSSAKKEIAAVALGQGSRLHNVEEKRNKNDLFERRHGKKSQAKQARRLNIQPMFGASDHLLGIQDYVCSKPSSDRVVAGLSVRNKRTVTSNYNDVRDSSSTLAATQSMHFQQQHGDSD